MWDRNRCANWLMSYANSVASDSYKMGGDELLYSCAGAAYYAIHNGIGMNTKKEFIDLIVDHFKIDDDDFIEEAISEIENVIAKTN